MAKSEDSIDDVNLKSPLRDHVSNSEFVELRSDVKWVVWFALLVIGAAIIRFLLLPFLETS